MMDARQGTKSHWSRLGELVTLLGTLVTIFGVTAKDLFGLLRDNLAWSHFVAFLWYPAPAWTHLAWLFALLNLWAWAGIRLRGVPKVIPPTKPVVSSYNPALDRAMQPLPRPRRVDAVVLAEIDQALDLFEKTYDRKKAKGYGGWVLEDISQLSTTFLHIIDRYAEPNGVHPRLANEAVNNEADRRSRMLLLHGIVQALRNSLSGNDSDRAGATLAQPGD